MYSEKVRDLLQARVDIPVVLGMRYGSMSIEKGLAQLEERGVEHTLVVPCTLNSPCPPRRRSWRR